MMDAWSLQDGGTLQSRLGQMVRPALFAGHFGTSFTRCVAGIQYHLGGAVDTAELASLAGLSAEDHVLDVCCFVGGPALQVAEEFSCRVTGVDLMESAIDAANRLADIAGLSSLTEFFVADAMELPFGDGSFTVVWNQCSLESDERWLREFDRVLSPGGRFAFTFQSKGRDDDRWTLSELSSLLKQLGYTVTHAEDITQRDVEIGWEALDRKLSRQEAEFRAAMGDEWVRRAHEEFRTEAERMTNGEYGNARIVASKPGRQ
jgi:ubiquinone/menaquinone biosynthesis C-methylase UbiE